METNEKSIFSEILEEIKEKIKKIPLLAQLLLFNTNSFFSKLTTVSSYYAIFVSLIYVILLGIIYMKDPYDIYEKHPLYVLGGMLFLFFWFLITYSFIGHREKIKQVEPTRNTKKWWSTFV